MKRPSLSYGAVAVLVCLPALLAVAGCASPGQPRPPSLHIPRPVSNLQAAREGAAVHLSWTTPADTTDGQGIRGVLQAVLCREPARISVVRNPVVREPATPDCHRAGSSAVVPGPSTADDTLPPGLQTGPPALLRYRVQLLNAEGRTAGPSKPAYVLAGEAPAPVGPVTATLARGGVLLRWTPSPSSSGSQVELQRTLVSAAARPAAPRPASPAPAPFPVGKHPAAVPVLLRAQPGSPEAGAPAPHDAGGLLDPGVRPGDRYRYVAQRTETVTVPGPAGPLTLELRGQASAPVEITFEDTFPPQAPAGLVALATPANPDAHPPAPAGVDLSWEGSIEAGVAGYNVYRDGPGLNPMHRLNAAPLPAPAFHDTDVTGGATYTYQVTAVGRAGQESAPSTSAVATVPQP